MHPCSLLDSVVFVDLLALSMPGQVSVVTEVVLLAAFLLIDAPCKPINLLIELSFLDLPVVLGNTSTDAFGFVVAVDLAEVVINLLYFKSGVE